MTWKKKLRYWYIKDFAPYAFLIGAYTGAIIMLIYMWINRGCEL